MTQFILSNFETHRLSSTSLVVRCLVAVLLKLRLTAHAYGGGTSPQLRFRYCHYIINYYVSIISSVTIVKW